MGKAVSEERFKWQCPKCGAEPHKHGRGGQAACLAEASECEGFICECEMTEDYSSSELPDHGHVRSNPCENANCFHCGYGGAFPPPPPKSWPKWAQTALKEHWSPPKGWQPKETA